MAQAKEHARDLKMEDPLRLAVKKISKASDIMPDNTALKVKVAKYESWEEGWRNFIGKEAPAIEKGFKSGKLISSRAKLYEVHDRINKAILPPNRHDDPVILGLNQVYRDKYKEYKAVMFKSGYTVRDLQRDRDPRGLITHLDKILQDWEHEPESLRYHLRNLDEAKQKVRIAISNDGAGDSYREEKNYPAAIDRYQVSLRYQQDAIVQSKLDSFLNRHASAAHGNEDKGGRGSYDYGEDAGNVDQGSITAGGAAPLRSGSTQASNQVQQNIASGGAAIGTGYREDPIIDAQRERELAEDAVQAISAASLPVTTILSAANNKFISIFDMDQARRFHCQSSTSFGIGLWREEIE